MHFHLPKPMHGWREFLGEVGIIVVGVLIALGAEQFLDDLNWHEKVRYSELQLRAELLEAAANADERMRLNSCFVGKLDDLQHRLLSQSEQNAAPPYRSRYWTIVRLWSTDAWDTARAGDVLTHMQGEKVRRYAALYRQVAVIRDNLGLEQQYIADLSILPSIDGRISEVTRDRLLAAVTRSRRANEMIIRDSKQVLAAAGDIGIKLSQSTRTPLHACGTLYQPLTI